MKVQVTRWLSYYDKRNEKILFQLICASADKIVQWLMPQEISASNVQYIAI